MFSKTKDFASPEHNGQWSCQRRYSNKNRELSGNNEAIHF
jgi:hypothetical protein